MGIIEGSTTSRLADDSLYDKVIRYNKLDTTKKSFEQKEEFGKVEYRKGFYQVTKIGELFIKACCR